MMAFSMAIIRFFAFDPAWLLDFIAIVLFAVGAALIVIGYRIYLQSSLHLNNSNIAGNPRWLLGIVDSITIILVALVLLLSLLNY